MNLRGFLASNQRNAWCVEGSIKVYARRGRRYVDGQPVQTMDVASLTSSKPGSGRLAEIMDDAEALSVEFGLDGVYVENVLNERLRPWLEARGYHKLTKTADFADMAPCYWRAN